MVSLAPSLTRVVLAIGARGDLVGVDRFSADLPGLTGVAVLGGLLAPDLERMVELRPTLVLGVQSAQQEALFAQMQSLGAAVETFRLHSLEEVLDAFERVGVLVGRAEAGRALAMEVRARLEDVERSTRDRARPRVALVVEREPLFVVGGGSFASRLIEIAGGRNVFGDLRTAYPRVSLEALAGRAPEVLLETIDGIGEPGAHWRRLPSEPRFVALAGTDVVLPSPDLPDAAQRLRDAIHPELRGNPPGEPGVP